MRNILLLLLASIPASMACDLAIETETPKDLYILGESIEYSHILNNKSFGFIITYWIEDGSGEIVKSARNTTNTNSKRYTPSDVGEYVLKALLNVECNDTLLENNYFEKQVVVELNSSKENETIVNDTIIIGNTTETNESVEINSTVEINITINNSNSSLGGNNTDNNSSIKETVDLVVGVASNETGSNESCDASIEIAVSKDLLQNGEQLKYSHLIEDAPNYIIEYWIEDLFGKVVKSARNTTNVNEKSYTPKINEKDKTIILKALLKSDCGNASAEKYVTIKNQDYVYVDYSKKSSSKSSGGGSSGKVIVTEVKETEPEPTIKSFYTLTKKFEQGKEIKLFASVEEGVEVRAIIGNETGNISVVDGKATILHNLSYGNNTVKLQTLKNGKILDEEKLSFYVEGSIEQNLETLSTKNESTESLKNKKEILESTTYESESENTSSVAKYVLLGISTILNVVLIWRK